MTVTAGPRAGPMAGPPDANTEYVCWVAPSSPVNTPATAPTETSVGISTAWVWRVEVRIPPGHAGYTGLALVDSGSFLVPYSQASPGWLIGDDDLLEYPLGKQVGDNLQLWTYNTSTDYTHAWQVRVVYTPMSTMDEGGSVIVTPEPADWLAELAGPGQ